VSGLIKSLQFTGGWAALNPSLTGDSTGERMWLSGLSSGFTDLVKALDGKNRNGTLSSLFGSDKTIKHVVSASAVPVPGTVWLFGTGLIGGFCQSPQPSYFKTPRVK
jgi:hypothetical protein